MVCGSFFFTLAQFLIGTGESAGPGLGAGHFYLHFFWRQFLDGVPQIIAAFVLRRLAGPLQWTEAWHWAVGGAGLFLLVLIALGLSATHSIASRAGSRLRPVGRFVFGQATHARRHLAGAVRGALTALFYLQCSARLARDETSQRRSV